MTGLFGGKSPTVEPAPATPTRSDADVQAAALAERRRRALAFGRKDTIITGGQGVTNGATPNVKVLLGE